jgi:hypothetical protein
MFWKGKNVRRHACFGIDTHVGSLLLPSPDCALIESSSASISIGGVQVRIRAVGFVAGRVIEKDFGDVRIREQRECILKPRHEIVLRSDVLRNESSAFVCVILVES